MSLPKTYKAAQISEKGGKFELVDKEFKQPGKGEVVLKVLACGVCFGDGLVVHQEMPTGLPRIPGHEIIGDVVAVGPGETAWKVGDRAGGGWHGGHCGSCDTCRSGDMFMCDSHTINGVFLDGGYAEYVTLRSEAVVHVPTDMDPAEAAPLLCAGVATYNSLRNTTCRPGDIVAVQGIGGLGTLAIQYAARSGFRVVALSSGSSKRQHATELGAAEYVDTSKENAAEAVQKLGGATVAICTATNADVVPGLLATLRPGGTLLMLSAIPEVKVSAGLMVAKRLSVKGFPSGTAKDSEDTIAFSRLAGIKSPVEKFRLEQAQEAFDHMISGKVRGRAVLVP